MQQSSSRSAESRAAEPSKAPKQSTGMVERIMILISSSSALSVTLSAHLGLSRLSATDRIPAYGPRHPRDSSRALLKNCRSAAADCSWSAETRSKNESTRTRANDRCRTNEVTRMSSHDRGRTNERSNTNERPRSKSHDRGQTNEFARTRSHEYEQSHTGQ